MPSITLYEIFVPTFLKAVKTLDHLLQKTEEYAREHNEDPSLYVSAALVDGMNPLSFQVQAMSNTIKKAVWRLTGAETGNWPEDESTIPALRTRLQRTTKLLSKVDAKALEGKEDLEVELQVGSSTRKLEAKAYVLNYAIPNVFFHLQTAYAILRARGLPLGKSDYLGGFMN